MVTPVTGAPRIRLVPDSAVSSLGARAVELAAGAGLVLDEQQQAILHHGCGVTAGHAWAADEVAVVVARQNLKSTVLLARMLLGLERGEQALYTAHRVDSAGEVFRSLADLVRASPVLEPQLTRIVFSNGREAVQLENGGRVMLGTRSTSRTGRGFSLDTIYFDEAMYLAEEAVTSIVPTLSARQSPVQVWYAGSAVDETIHEHGLILARVRERARSGEAKSLCYFEFSAAVLDADGRELQAGEVTPEMVDDEELWRQANPAIAAGRMTIERLRAERETMPHRGWIVERLGIGQWPDTSGTVAGPISLEEWRELCDPGSKRVGDLVLAYDVQPDRRAALVACGRRGDDELLHVELIRVSSGTGWLIEELQRLDAKYAVEQVVCDGYGGNVAIARALEDAGVKVRPLTGGEQAAACAKLLDLVGEQGFRHIGQPEVEQALRGAQAKPVGDAWAWSRKRSSGDVAIVVALTLALTVGAEVLTGSNDPWVVA